MHFDKFVCIGVRLCVYLFILYENIIYVYTLSEIAAWSVGIFKFLVKKKLVDKILYNSVCLYVTMFVRLNPIPAGGGALSAPLPPSSFFL